MRIAALALGLLAITAAAPLAAADPVCVGEGPWGFCTADPDEIISIQPPIYCLHIEPCDNGDV